MSDEHYRILGLEPGASLPQIRAAYRQIMRTNHPDVRPGDPAAEEIARRANAAWAALRRGHQAPRPPRRVTPIRSPDEAYAAHGRAYRSAVSAAFVKVAAAVLVCGLIALFGSVS